MVLSITRPCEIIGVSIEVKSLYVGGSLASNFLESDDCSSISRCLRDTSVTSTRFNAESVGTGVPSRPKCDRILVVFFISSLMSTLSRGLCFRTCMENFFWLNLDFGSMGRKFFKITDCLRWIYGKTDGPAFDI